MTAQEKREFARLSKVVDNGIHTFAEVGRALLEIRERKLYRAEHKSFEEYCREKYAMSRAHAYRLMESSRVMEDLSPIGDKMPLPSNEGIARALVRYGPPELRREIWTKAVEMSARELKPITAGVIARVASEGCRTMNGGRQRRRKSGATLAKFVEEIAAALELGDIDKAKQIVGSLRVEVNRCCRKGSSRDAA